MLPIGIGVKPKVGKDTVARFLISYLRVNGCRLNIQRASLFNEAQILCSRIFSWTDLKHPNYYETEFGNQEKDKTLLKIGKTPREIWSEFLIGLRQIYPDTLIQYLFSISQSVDILVITDITTPDEIQMIKDYGGHFIELDRNYAGNEITENTFINNNGTLNELYNKVVETVKTLGLDKL
jgi:hypothetical protein